MLKSADLESIYYLFNCSTGLVLEISKDNQVEFHHCKERHSQKFKVSPVLGEHEQYTFVDYSKAMTVLERKGEVTCEASSGQQDAVWLLRKTTKDRILYHSAVIECVNSGYVM